MTRVQRAVVYLMIAGVAVALLIGFWPVHANVVGDPSYACGSGFLHHQHQWVVDSRTLNNERTGELDEPVGTARMVCPGKVLDHRDLALWIGGFVIVFGVLILALTTRPQNRSTQAIFATQRLRDSRR